MILQALNSYYERLVDDPSVKIAPFGFSRQKISFEVVLEKDGTFFAIQRLDSIDGKRQIPSILTVPGYKSRQGQKPTPNLLWDNPLYLFGIAPEGRDKAWAQKRFESFRDFHRSLQAEINDLSYSAVSKFLGGLESSKPPCVASDLGIYNGVFRIRSSKRYVHECERVVEWWGHRVNSGAEEAGVIAGQCLVTGAIGALARTHEPPTGSDISGAKNSAKIVSFNFDSAESLGKDQSFNSPVSLRAAFQYSTALKTLCRRDSRQRIEIGDATTVFWTERPTEAEKLLPWIFGPSKTSEDKALKLRIHSLLKQIASGTYPSEFGEPDTQFFILGLSPNAARVSVRFWHVSTLGELIRNLGQHFMDLEICDIQKTKRVESYRFEFANPCPSPRRILGETVPAKQGMPDQEKVSPQLAGALITSIIINKPYPAALLNKVLYRIWADGFIDPDKRNDWRQARQRRASIVKACLNRRFRQPGSHMEDLIVDAYLNKIHPDPAYHCGRLMGVIAFIQEVALNKVNASVVRRFLSAASSTPALHLGRLQVQAEIAHLPKLKGKLPKYLRDEMKAINCQIQDEIPPRINQLRQGLFVLGFYHELAHLEHQRMSIRRLHRTRLGEWVYSRGELMLADALAAQGIEYVYEPKAILSGEDRIPDFLICGTEKNEHRYIEYLGMDSEEYNEDWEKKYQAYLKAGITEEGGPNGRLYLIDGRKDTWDEVRIHVQLKEWFSS